MTQETYKALLFRVEESNPNNPILPQLRKGLTAMNQIRIISEVEKLSENPENEPENDAEFEEDAELSEIPANSDDPLLKRLYIQKSNLFVTRAKYSNMLHECVTDSERARVVKSILAAQSDIEAHFGRIRTYVKTGRLPEEDEQFPIPADSVKLVLKLNSVRANLSLTQAKIRELYQTEPKTVEIKQELEKRDLKERHLNLYKKILEDEIKRRKVTDVHEG